MGLELEPRADVLLGVRFQAALNGKAQVHWHYDPGPIGGFGGNVGVTIPRKEHELVGSIHLVSTPAPILEARLDGTDSIKLAVSAGLGTLESVGLGQTVPLPKARLFSAPMPTGLQETVHFDFGGTVIQRKVTALEITISSVRENLTVTGKVLFEETH